MPFMVADSPSEIGRSSFGPARPPGRRRQAGLVSGRGYSGLLDLSRLGGQPLVARRAGGRVRRTVLSHEPIRRAGDRARRAVDFYSKGLARLEGRWAGQGVQGLEYLDLEHPYAADLDIFGAGSLFERLCTARTRAGEETLASWLLKPATPATIRERHEAVAELRPRLDLREDLELLGVDVRGGIDPACAAEWSTGDRVFRGKTVFFVASILGVLGTAALVVWIAWNTLAFLLVMIAVDAVFGQIVSGRVKTVPGRRRSSNSRPHLALGAAPRLERESFQSALLQRLVKSLETDGLTASSPDSPAGPAARCA